MTKKKKIIAITVPIAVVLVIAIILIILFFGLTSEPPVVPEVSFDFDGLGTAPADEAPEGTDRIDASSVDSFSDSLSEDVNVIEDATYLFNIANQNLGKVDFYVSFAAGGGTANITSVGMGGSMEVREIRVIDGDSMYMESMGQVVQGYMMSNPDVSNVTIENVCKGILEYGNRKYTPDGQTFYLQEGGSYVLGTESLSSFLEGTGIDWTKSDPVRTESVDEFMTNEFYRYSYVEASSNIINTDTILKASLVHNEAEGYYEIQLVVDINSNALELSTASTRDSAGSDDIVYTHQTITCHVWENGLMRYFNTEDGWKGTLAGFLSGESNNTWEKYFSYNREDVSVIVTPTDLSWAK